jgi:hypothetical protein
MKTHHRVTKVLLMSILAGFLVLSAGMASAGSLGLLRAPAGESTVRHDPTTCVDPQDQGVPVDLGGQNEGTSEECVEPGEPSEPGESDETTQPGPPANPTYREPECQEAAGLSTVQGANGGPNGTVAVGTGGGAKVTGLDHAIEVVLANCIKNPQARGLVNALRHLVANRDRHLAHRVEKAERRATRDAAKAGRGGKHGPTRGKGSK